MSISRQQLVRYVQAAGQSYWSASEVPADIYRDLPPSGRPLGNSWTNVSLPNHLTDLGVDGVLWVDKAAISPGAGEEFHRCDWFTAAFSYLAAIAEQRHEQSFGSIHSISSRLKIPERCFDYAWANRILLLIRRLEAERLRVDEATLFGPLPAAKVFLTHDIDALDKTLQIRLKQSVFELFNLVRFTLSGRLAAAGEALWRALRMALKQSNYYFLDEVADVARSAGLDTIFYVHSRRRYRSPNQWLIDPSYYATDERIVKFVNTWSGYEKIVFGLHPSVNSWRSPTRLHAEREALQTIFDTDIRHVRQHWLRFSWERTPNAQATAELAFDSTIGFNDRAGFRCGAALVYQPWNLTRNSTSKIESIPLILMDSHLYSYNAMGHHERIALMTALIQEIHAVGGTAAVLWHPHTLASDYGWRDGYRDLVDILASHR